jgi:hypothetical protein
MVGFAIEGWRQVIDSENLNLSVIVTAVISKMTS